MKTKSIIYKSFVPQVESTPAISLNESPTFKYTGYKPHYKWSDDIQEASNTTSEVQSESKQEVKSESKQQINWEDPASIDWSKITGHSIISEAKRTKSRGKHVFKTPDIQVGEMQGLLDAFADAGISLRITSGTRTGAHTKQGKQSWHALGRALDVTPIAGQTFKDLAEQIRNSPDLIKYMQDNGYGIYDETTPETLTDTGGTGPHWHLGPDRNAILGLEQILNA